MTSIVDTSVKHFYSAMAGAPTVSGTAGSLISTLDACLVTGWGAKAVDSAVISNGICRLNFASGKSAAEVQTVIWVAGASPAGLDGEQRITAVANGWVEFKTALPDGVVTGSVSFKMAPLGWEKVFAATNKAVYRSQSPAGTRMYLRVDDTGTINARTRAYEGMTDIDSGVAAIPLAAQVAGGLYWPKSGAASTLGRPWYLCGDARGLLLSVDPQSGGRFTAMFAGDIASLKSGDAWGFLITGNQSDQTAANGVPDGCCGYSRRTNFGGAYLARSHNGIGESLSAQRIGSHHTGNATDTYAGAGGYAWGAYPNGANNGLMVGTLELFAQSSMRGAVPGLLHPVQDLAANFSTGTIVEGTDDFAGRKLLALRVGSPVGSSWGTVFVDVSGPWGRR